MHPKDKPGAFADALNRGDIAAMCEMYTFDAILVMPDGHIAQGADAIRDVLSGLVAAGARMTITRDLDYVIGDRALVICDWTLTIGGQSQTGRNVEVQECGDDGRWRCVIDRPAGTA